MRSIKIALLIILLAISVPNAASAYGNGSYSLKTIVIDPGHGGKHPGTIWAGGKYKEKEIVLDVALKLGTSIKEKYPHINVIYTRTTDKFVDLADRSAIANKAKADLFISIHVNAAKATSVHGTETFVMGTSKSDANFELVKAENSVITMEDNYQTKYEGFDPSSPESYIIFSLIQNTHLESSLELAEIIERNYGESSPITYSRGVKQGGLLVLWQCTMPAILTEIGFLSNKADRELLATSSGRTRIAESLFNAFCNYKASVEGTDSTGDGAVIRNNEEAPQEKPAVKPQKNKSAKKLESSEKEYFAVQILAVPKPLKKGAADLKGRKDARMIRSRRVCKYIIGNFASRSEAAAQAATLRKKFKGAFVVHVKNGSIVK